MNRKFTSLAFVSFLLLITPIQTALADYWKGGKTWGGVTIYEFDSSVYDYTYDYEDVYNQAISNWEGISSEVSFTEGEHKYADKYYVGKSSIEGLLGRMDPYSASGITSLDKNWNYTKVHIFDNNMKSYGMTKAQRISNATHEIGHSLKLAHPTQTVTSVMNQGIQSIGPKSYDKSELKDKWGN